MDKVKSYFRQYSKKQLILFGTFVLILILIPITMLLIKNSWTQNNLNYQPVTTAKGLPPESSLDQLKVLIKNLTPTPTSSITSISLGPSLNIKIQIQGRNNFQDQAKIFIGIAQGQITLHPNFLLTFSADVSPSGDYSGLSLAGLNPGESYTVYIKGPGQIDSSSTFTMEPFEINLNNGQAVILTSGDLNEDNQINQADLTILNNLYSTTPASSNWNNQADFNLDGIINPLDGSILMNNIGKVGVSGIWQSKYPSSPSSDTFNNSNVGGIEESTSSGGYWVWIPKIDKTTTNKLK